MPGSVRDGVLLLYGAVSALVAPALAVAARRLTREDRPAGSCAPVGSSTWWPSSPPILAFGFVIGDMSRRTTEGTGDRASRSPSPRSPSRSRARRRVGCASRAGRPTSSTWRWPRACSSTPSWCSARTALAFLDGYHLHALVVIGSTLLFLSEFHAGTLGRLLAIDGLALTVPAVVRYGRPRSALEPLPRRRVVRPRAGRDRVGRRRAATRVARALRRRRRAREPRALRLLAASRSGGSRVLRHAARAHAPRRRDAAARGGSRPAANLALVVPGIALLYGSVAVQVVRSRHAAPRPDPLRPRVPDRRARLRAAPQRAGSSSASS